MDKSRNGAGLVCSDNLLILFHPPKKNYGVTNILRLILGFKTLVTEGLSFFNYKMIIHGTHKIFEEDAYFVSLYIHTLCMIYICTFMISTLRWAVNTFYV